MTSFMGAFLQTRKEGARQMRVGLRWTDAEITRVRELAALGFQSQQIARLIGRSRDGVSHRCTQLGIRLPRNRCFGSAPADRSTWDEADRLSICANVPHELAEFVVDCATHFNIELKSLRSSCKTEDLVKCRNHIAVTARQLGYSLPVIGRAINRDHTTIHYAVKKAGDLSALVLVDHRVEAA